MKAEGQCINGIKTGKHQDRLSINRRIWLLPVLALVWNESVYYGARLLTRNSKHYELVLPIDHQIPIVSWTIAIYFSCFLIWAVSYVYLASQEKTTAYRFFLADMIGKAAALFFFLLIPTTITRPVIAETGIWDTLLNGLYGMDTPDNLFPSIHCMVSWYCFIGIRKLKDFPLQGKIAVLLFAIAVCVSTVTTKQHVVADIAGGILIAEISYVVSCFFIKNREKTDRFRNRGILYEFKTDKN